LAFTNDYLLTPCSCCAAQCRGLRPPIIVAGYGTKALRPSFSGRDFAHLKGWARKARKKTFLASLTEPTSANWTLDTNKIMKQTIKHFTGIFDRDLDYYILPFKSH